MENHYVGSELDLFADASNWKAYWSSILRPLLGRRVLDVGAGIGATAALFADQNFDHYLALEPDPVLAARIVQARQFGRLPQDIEVQVGTTDDLCSGVAFDTILYVDVLEHIENDKAELAKAESVLSPGGRLIVLAPAHQWLYSPFDAAVGHYRRYRRESLLAAKPPQLEVERIIHLDSVGLFASLANRWALRSGMPTAGQIRFWDGSMVPVSRVLDKVLGFSAGKTIVGVFRKPGQGP